MLKVLTIFCFLLVLTVAFEDCIDPLSLPTDDLPSPYRMRGLKGKKNPKSKGNDKTVIACSTDSLGIEMYADQAAPFSLAGVDGWLYSQYFCRVSPSPGFDLGTPTNCKYNYYAYRSESLNQDLNPGKILFGDILSFWMKVNMFSPVANTNPYFSIYTQKPDGSFYATRIQWRLENSLPLTSEQNFATLSMPILVYIGTKPSDKKSDCTDATCVVINLCDHVTQDAQPFSNLCGKYSNFDVKPPGNPPFDPITNKIWGLSVQSDSQADAVVPVQSMLAFGYDTTTFTRKFLLKSGAECADW